MNCYYHQDSTAVGICRSCAKGICADCAIDGVMVCSEECREKTENIENLIDKRNDDPKFSLSQLLLFPSFMVFMGVVLLVILYVSERLGTLTVLIPAGFIVFGLVAGINNIKINRRFDRDT